MSHLPSAVSAALRLWPVKHPFQVKACALRRHAAQLSLPPDDGGLRSVVQAWEGGWDGHPKPWSSGNVGEDFMDERCLGVGIGLAVVAMLPGKFLFEMLVACGDGGIGPQHVPES